MATVQPHNTQVWLTPTHVSPWCWQPICLFPGCQRRRLCSHSGPHGGKKQPLDTLHTIKMSNTRDPLLWYSKELMLNYFRKLCKMNNGRSSDTKKHQNTRSQYQRIRSALGSNTHHCTLAGPLNWLFLPLLPEREPDPGLEPELGLEPVLPLELCSHSSCRVHIGEMKQKQSASHGRGPRNSPEWQQVKILLKDCEEPLEVTPVSWIQAKY